MEKQKAISIAQAKVLEAKKQKEDAEKNLEKAKNLTR